MLGEDATDEEIWPSPPPKRTGLPGRLLCRPKARTSYEPLPRLTKKVFTDLAIWMTGLGLLMGVVFPFFVMAFGVPSTYVLSAKFFFATIGAGLVVGATNHFLSRAVVGSRLRFMSLEDVEGRIDTA